MFERRPARVMQAQSACERVSLSAPCLCHAGLNILSQAESVLNGHAATLALEKTEGGGEGNSTKQQQCNAERHKQQKWKGDAELIMMMLKACTHQVGLHCVCAVTQQGNAAFRPAEYRGAVVNITAQNVVLWCRLDEVGNIITPVRG